MTDLKMLLCRVWRTIYRRCDRYLYAFELEKMPAMEEPESQAVQGLEVVRLDGSNYHLLEGWQGIKPGLRREFDDMVKDGELGLFLLAGEQVAGHFWLISNPGPGMIDRGYLRIYPGEAYIHHLRVYHRPGAPNPTRPMSAQIKGLCAELCAKGFSTLKSHVLMDNRPAVVFSGLLLGGKIAGISTQWKVIGLNFRRIRLNERGMELSTIRW